MTISKLIEKLTGELELVGPDVEVYFTGNNDETYRVEDLIAGNDGSIELLPFSLD